MKVSSISINNGLFLGIILIIFTAVLSYTNPIMFIKSRSFLLSVPFLLILIKAGNEFRRTQGGIATFNEIMNITFFCGLIAVALCTTFEYIHFNFINEGLKDIEKEISLEAIELTKSILSEEMVEKNMQIIKEGDMYSLGQCFSKFLIRLLLPTALFSVLVSLIQKRNKPIIQP
ncbi:MAG: DUF4199 domain-containing protein [Saprospiraceae bacterium]|nr:DUF4199 domain-containing protein [Bacteroidia bacterium]NNE15281.1 DUF4199 domain-containing protein [Saprospiraceae bacterium]NNL91053.1 DUF4199 domain-containing protein [Saprospiraceae bacterium]